VLTVPPAAAKPSMPGRVQFGRVKHRIPKSAHADVGLKHIQWWRSTGTAWTHRTLRRQNRFMPLGLTDSELPTAATACRAMAYQEGKQAKKIENPTMRGPRRPTQSAMAH